MKKITRITLLAGFALGQALGLQGADPVHVRLAAYLFRLGSVFGAFGSSGMDLLHEYEHKIDLVFAERFVARVAPEIDMEPVVVRCEEQI